MPLSAQFSSLSLKRAPGFLSKLSSVLSLAPAMGGLYGREGGCLQFPPLPDKVVVLVPI